MDRKTFTSIDIMPLKSAFYDEIPPLFRKTP